VTAASIVPMAAAPLSVLIRKVPRIRPSPVFVSTRLRARIVSAPSRRASVLDAVPV
jgi:hypothetical protein